MAATERNRFLILCKTYPSPSAKYNETSCVAAMKENGDLIRLFPIPFRLLEDSERFKKWQWIEAVVKKANDDHRYESYKISVDTIKLKEIISTRSDWKDRYFWLDKLRVFNSFSDVSIEQAKNNTSIALLKPLKINRLEIVPSNDVWTEDEKSKLLKDNSTFDLFSQEQKPLPTKILEKIPFDFYFHYTCQNSDTSISYHKHKIVDWEICALYRTCIKNYGTNWEQKFREKFDKDTIPKNLHLLMGNMHRFQNQWLIISLIFPPIRDESQLNLF